MTSYSDRKTNEQALNWLLNDEGSSSYYRGVNFEEFVCKYLLSSKRFAFKKTYLWHDWAKEKQLDSEDSTDPGIDIVAKDNKGDYTAIQCKRFKDGQKLDRHIVHNFIAATGREYGGIRFKKRAFVTTNTNWTKKAERVFESYADSDTPVLRWYTSDIWNDRSVDLEKLLTDPDKAARDPYKLRPHQQDAINDVIKGFEQADRGKFISACGTGKTFTALKIAERMAAESATKDRPFTALVLVPSIALVSQTLQEWSEHCAGSLNRFAVCSDKSVNQRAAKQNNGSGMKPYDLIIPATTNPEELASGLWQNLSTVDGGRRDDTDSQISVVFSTYQSLGVVIDAQRTSSRPFDLIICDEAHRTTGAENPSSSRPQSVFKEVHDGKLIKARKRLYMTATQRIYAESAKSKAKDKNPEIQIYSMDDSEIYGEVFHELTFSRAIKKNLLCDYRVLVLGVSDKAATQAVQGIEELEQEDAAKIIGCWNGLAKRLVNQDEALPDPDPMKRAVSFANTIKYSKIFTQKFNDIVEQYRERNPNDTKMLRCEVAHVDGTQNALRRTQALHNLRVGPEDGACSILSNARCLSEGVDVPALDAVMFINPRRSPVDVVQSVGRVMRKAQGKKYGYIILPVMVDTDEKPEDALDKDDRYDVVWDILQALRSHDDRFDILINQIEMNKKLPEKVQVIGVDLDGDQEDEVVKQLSFRDAWVDEVRAKMVERVGNRRYWRNWTKSVAITAQELKKNITQLVQSGDSAHKKRFQEFWDGLCNNIHEGITKEDAIEMLAQHIITKPVFDALFSEYESVKDNAISQSMQKVLEQLSARELTHETSDLKRFYRDVEATVRGIKNPEGKQELMRELYDNFFNTILPKPAKRLGIVYTPVEIVDFILYSTDYLLKKHFGDGLTSKDVHILEPFAGTGIFIARLFQLAGLIRDEDLEHKYRHEIHANEILLLAYYIAANNIETAYLNRRGGGNEYKPFEGIVLTDTFQINENEGKFKDQIFRDNAKRIQRQKDAPIRVIMGNPPYSAWQGSENDANKNTKYPQLDESIRKTYAKFSKATLKNSLYDSYVRALRWASDSIRDKGIIAYVTNGGYIEGRAMDGLRKCLTDEFSAIYCFNLRGNFRLGGERARKEGGGVFGQSSGTTIAITFLIKQSDYGGRGKVSYHDIGDYLKSEEKLEKIRQFGSVSNLPWRTIQPDANNDWLNQRDPAFEAYLPMGVAENKRKNAKLEPGLFVLYSMGIKTNRDTWAYNFSKQAVGDNMSKMIRFYDEQRHDYQQRLRTTPNLDIEEFVSNDHRQIKWSGDLKQRMVKNDSSEFSQDKIRIGAYRPFVKQHLYLDRLFNNRLYRQQDLFPTAESPNRAICVSGMGASKDFSALMVDTVPRIDFLEKSQCFPRFRYKQLAANQAALASEDGIGSIRKVDNIPQATVELFRNHYGDRSIDGDAIFNYVYGVLHSPQYRKIFATSLDKSLPRIPQVESKDDFWAFSRAGEDLGELHIGYETLPEHDTVREIIQTKLYDRGPGDDELYRLKDKMRFAGKHPQSDKTAIIYNEHIRIAGIPLDAYEYVVNGRSALAWLMDYYRYKVDKDSRIINDPNQYSDNPRYIVSLVAKIVTLSLRTNAIVRTLPELSISTPNQTE